MNGPFDFAFCQDIERMNGGEQLLAAVACDKVDVVKRILLQYPELANYVGSTDPLKRKRYLSTLTVTRTPVSGVTPLHLVAGSFNKNREEIFDLLISAGANINAVDGQHASVLKWAFLIKNKSIIDKIIKLNEQDPLWKGKVDGAGKASQLLRGVIKAPKKVLSTIGKATFAIPSMAKNFMVQSLSGGKTRKKQSHKTRNTRRNR